MIAIPPRYEPIRRLGQGGGGEVWAVRDRVTGDVLALKVLAAGAGEHEVKALVREAIALSGLEGLGLPRVVAFGSLEDGRRYMLRDLVVGQSLEDVLDDDDGPPWLEPLARASEQLTVLHRAGLLHGDIKPANVIVGEGGAGTLVDLGLAAPWREGGTLAQGLTPKFAAPELLIGEPLTVRAEVYALGATLAEGMARRGSALDIEARIALTKIAARATEPLPAARYPSVDELSSALRRAAGLLATHSLDEAAWPVVGLEGTAQRLASAVATLGAGESLAIEGPRGSGRTTLARRMAWTLGVEGAAVVNIEAPRGGMSAREAVEIELAAYARPERDDDTARETPSAAARVIVVDDFAAMDDAGRLTLARASAAGARIVAVANRDEVIRVSKGRVRTFDVPPLDGRCAEDLVRRAMPSLPDALRLHLVERVEGRPGTLRAFLKKLGGRAIVSSEDIDAILAADSSPSMTPPSLTREEALASVERLLDMGRFDEASQQLEGLVAAAPRAAGAKKRDAGGGAAERVRLSIARARLSLGRGDAKEAATLLDSSEGDAQGSAYERAWRVARARSWLRAGDYPRAAAVAESVVATGDTDATAADSLAVRGVALAFTGEDVAAQALLERSVAIARAAADKRMEAVALGSLAIAHQRSGRTAEARLAYESSLAAAEIARDAGTVAATRLNLAVLAQGEGEIALALMHLEAAVDMGRRAGGLVALQQALLNLANLDLYLGRYARASTSIDSLSAQRERLGANARAQLLGLEAELATRTGDPSRGARLYEQCAAAWEAQGRPLDAAESRLEGILARARETQVDASQLGRELDALRAHLGEGGFREHEGLAGIVRGTIALLVGDEPTARVALDVAYEQARRAGRQEWAWRALDARARLAASQGAVALARRDTEQALAMLEETASKLPRDLREVFWDDPRRRALRQAHTATLPMPMSTALASARTSGVLRTMSAHGGTTTIGAPLPAEDRLARIFEITRELAVEHDMARLLGKVTDHAIALLGAERGFVVLASEDGTLETHAARDRKGDDPHASFSHSVAEKVVKTGEAVIATSARDDERLAQAVSVHQLMIQSIACVPIRGAPPAGRTIGALYLETRLRAGVRFEGELPTLAAFADQAAIAIENARLLEENRARAEDLALANAELAEERDKVAELLGRRTEQLAATRRDLKHARAQLRSHFGYAGLIGTSAPMRKLYAVIERIKDTDVPVLITGESGTGKEMVAKAVHASGARAKRQFLGVNCGAIPGNLLESELFGHVKGSFTGADRDRKGLFREAAGGTILLDEIGEMPLKMQTSLLRTLQESTVRPIGGATEEKVDVRIIAATNRELESMIKAGAFREDLYYRLHVVELKVPSLRERAEDVPPLIDHFLSLFAARYRRDRKAVAREAMRRLCAYDWPGNVRQLEHVLLNAWLMSEASEITVDDLQLPDLGRAPPAISETVVRQSAGGSGAGTSSVTPPSPGGTKARPRTQAEFKDSERDRILSALSSCNWNRVQAAKLIGVPRRTFYRRLKEYGIL
jgi:serine/threonine-protein kinase PknK